MAVLLTGILGCGSEPVAPKAKILSAVRNQKSPDEDFELALEMLDSADEFAEEQSRAQITYYLNRWMREQPSGETWHVDPLTERIPSRLQNLSQLRQLDSVEFQLDDVRFLQETMWLREVAQQVAAQVPPTPAGASSAARDLEVARRLFDWTVRNVQLEPLPEYPRPGAAGPQVEPRSSTAAREVPGPGRGDRGPGYTLYPWQVLLYGRGDAWQRARMFMLLARQQHLDSVMLAIDRLGVWPQPFPWLPAVWIDGQLYLFDPQLGLPIPGPGNEGVATLQQVLEDPTLLESLSVEGTPYRVGPEDLKGLVALVDAAPGYLSRRMELVERRLTGRHRMVLSVHPSRLAEQLQQKQSIGRVALWNVPFETIQYREAYDERREEDVSLGRQYFLDEGIFETRLPSVKTLVYGPQAEEVASQVESPWFFGDDKIELRRPQQSADRVSASLALIRGRRQHLRGQFENSDDGPGAKVWYLEARAPDQIIDQIPTSPTVQASLGIHLIGDANHRRQAAELATLYYRHVKHHATYWMGVALYESGDYQVAVDWLGNRTLPDQDSPWTAGARYNLARCYEQLGEPQKAIELYRQDDSPQQLGNLLRARWLEEQGAAAE